MRLVRDMRVFFALWPEDALRSELAAAAETLTLVHGARRVPVGNLHLTLHFVGNIERGRLDCLKAAASEVSVQPFELTIDCQGFFAKPRVAWLGCQHTPAVLLQLHRDLGASLRNCDYEPESRAFNPHVTVMRKSTSVETRENFEPMRWSVDRFALVESKPSVNGVEYAVIESWSLL